MSFVNPTEDSNRFLETFSNVRINKDTVGGLITSSKAYREWASKNGQRTFSCEVPSVGALHRVSGTILGERLTGDPATTTGLTSIDKQPDIVQLGVQPIMVGDLLAHQPTQHVTVRYIKENTFANAASAVAENGQLPEATWDLVESDTQVRKIGALARTTEEMLTDIPGAQTYFNQRLGYMVQAKIDNQLLNGDGTGVNLLGILNTPGIQNQAQGSDFLPDAVMKAITNIRAVGYFEPTAIIANPLDWQNLVLVKDRNAQYYGQAPFWGPYGTMVRVGQVMWGLPVVLTTFLARGTILVGAFAQGATIFNRMGMTLEVTNSDNVDFQYGRMAIRAIMRLALAVNRPAAFCTVTGTNGVLQ